MTQDHVARVSQRAVLVGVRLSHAGLVDEELTDALGEIVAVGHGPILGMTHESWGGPTADALALGATLSDFQPRHNVRVLFDPAGHPFCLCLDEGD